MKLKIQRHLIALRGVLFASAILMSHLLVTPHISLAKDAIPAVPITHGDTTKPRIALTFDACQTLRQKPGFDARIVDELVRTGTPATFFLGGLWMRSHPNETVMLASNPLFELGSHSWSHLDFSKISANTIRSEIEQTQDEMQQLVGRKPTLFRFPYGHFNPAAVRQVEDLGLTPIQWDVVSGDPSPSDTATRMDRIVTSRVHNGSIVVMHVNGRGWHTAEALPKIIADLKAQGYEFVTVSALLNN